MLLSTEARARKRGGFGVRDAPMYLSLGHEGGGSLAEKSVTPTSKIRCAMRRGSAELHWFLCTTTRLG
ncbi:hypothetical protein AKJ09_09166 [Labilithrix luteola]|uniref:Uncharacterized protein n=1 Tax=Labilithrix luteola TaxID=1391654 RepID=A0A0K1Q9U4_9BACT|nr:hypothetical protein AKJ09_09166 [Labilithrix luteola]